jgi:hypothetical protein
MVMSHERIGRVIAELSLYPKVKNRDEAADEVRKKIGFKARDGQHLPHHLRRRDAGAGPGGWPRACPRPSSTTTCACR